MSEEKLLAEKKQIEQRQERRRKQDREDNERLCQIAEKLTGLRLMQFVDVPGGVKLNSRYGPKEQYFKISRARGTLLKVNRTRARVDFGELGIWTWPISELIAADSRQGVTMEALAAGDMGDV